MTLKVVNAIFIVNMDKKQNESEGLYKYTLKLPRSLAHEIKKLAIDKELTIAQLIEESLREKLRRERKTTNQK